MSNSVTVTVSMGDGASAAQSFDLGGDGTAPPPIGDSAGADSYVAETRMDGGDPPPPMTGDNADMQAGSDGDGSTSAPPPGHDDADDAGSDFDFDEDAPEDDALPPPDM